MSVGFLSCIQELHGFDFIGPPSFGSHLGRKKEFAISLSFDRIGFAGIDFFTNSKLVRTGCDAITPQDIENIKLLAKYHIGKTELQFDLGFVDHFVSFLANNIKLDYGNNKRFKDALLSFLTGFSFAAVYTKFGKDQQRIKTLRSDTKRLMKTQEHDQKRFQKILDKLRKKYVEAFAESFEC